MQRGFLFFGDGDLGEQLRRLLALALHHLPARLDRHHLSLAHRSAVRRLLRARFRLLPARGRFRQRAQNRFRVRHAALHSVDRRAHAVSLLAREILSDAQLLVAEDPREELSAPAGVIADMTLSSFCPVK
jgi:hypothetical protein